MTFISRGFRGRRAAEVPAGRLPPGQYATNDFPVLSAGPTPIVRTEDWRFELSGRLAEPRSWTWEEFRKLPTEEVTADIHCETKWSKIDTGWTGVSIDTLLRDVDTDAKFVLAHSYGGYSSNLPIEDVTGGKAWIAFAFDGEAARARARRPGAAPRAASLLLEERQVGARHRAARHGQAWLLGDVRLPQLR